MDEDRWRAAAACRHRTAAMFDSAQLKEARSLCQGCPVEQICLWASVRDESAEDRYGVAGGMTPSQRAVLATRLSPAVIEAAHEAALAAWETTSFAATLPLGMIERPTPRPAAAVSPEPELPSQEVLASQEVVATVAAAFRLAPEQLCGRSRTRQVVEARQVVMYVLREVHGLSYPAIGAVVGRDHTTVMQAIVRVRARLAESPTWRRGVDGLVANIRGDTPEPVAVGEDLGLVDARNVVEQAARVCGVRPEQLCGRSRTRHVVEARQVAMYVLREVHGLSYPAIGAVVGGRDHTTAMHGVERIRQGIAEPGGLRDRVQRILTATGTAAGSMAA